MGKINPAIILPVHKLLNKEYKVINYEKIKTNEKEKEVLYYLFKNDNSEWTFTSVLRHFEGRYSYDELRQVFAKLYIRQYIRVDVTMIKDYSSWTAEVEKVSDAVAKKNYSRPINLSYFLSLFSAENRTAYLTDTARDFITSKIVSEKIEAVDNKADILENKMNNYYKEIISLVAIILSIVPILIIDIKFIMSIRENFVVNIILINSSILLAIVTIFMIINKVFFGKKSGLLLGIFITLIVYIGLAMIIQVFNLFDITIIKQIILPIK